MPRRVALIGCAVLWVTCCSVAWSQQRSPAPIHPFKKRLLDEVGAAWYRAVEANSKKIPVGTVRIAVTLLPNGKISKLRVLSNTSNQLFAKICLSAIEQTKIPPVPRELLSGGKFQDELSFKMFAN
jgi:outer membrane biosynthesis protein TonB